MSAWKPPLIVAATAVSIVGGFYLGGPGLGMAVGALAATSILAMAARNPPLHPIVPPRTGDRRRHVLVVLDGPLEAAGMVESLLRAIEEGDDGELEEPDVLVVALSRNRFLDRWTSDLDRGRHRAQRDLVLSLAALAAAGVRARARVGDEDLEQAVEDELGSFPATEVVLIAGDDSDAVASLESRVRVPLRSLRFAPECSPRPAGPVATRTRF